MKEEVEELTRRRNEGGGGCGGADIGAPTSSQICKKWKEWKEERKEEDFGRRTERDGRIERRER